MGRHILRLVLAFALAAGFSRAAEAKSLVYCAEGGPAGFDPALHTDPATLDASSQAIYNRLVQFRPGTAEVVPALAESWEISADGREYTFRLRPGVKFHTTADFTPSRAFNADDVVFTFERQWRADHPWYDYATEGWPWFDGMSLPEILQDVRKIDDNAVSFVLARPHAPFLADLAMDFASILSREYADILMAAGEREKLDLVPVGTGPFRLIEHQPGVAVRYDANPDYWRRPPAIENLTFEITPDSGVRFEKLKSGGCQVIPSPNPADLAGIRAEEGLVLHEGPGLGLSYLAFNTAEPPFDRARVRRAIARAIDTTAIVTEVYKGAADPAAGLLPALMAGGKEDAGWEAFDPAAARAALDAAGAAGAPLRLWALPAVRPYNPDPGRMAAMIEAGLDAAGLAAGIVSTSVDEFIAATLATDREGAVLLGWVSDNGDPDNVLAPLLGCDAVGISNRAFWCNARFDALLDEARRTVDPASRARLYSQAQHIIADEAPVIPIAHVGSAVAAVDSVTGLVVDAFGRHNFETVDIATDE